jgi:CheY-like chemotaxis protein
MLALFVGTDLECARAIARNLSSRGMSLEISTDGAGVAAVQKAAPALIVAKIESGGSTLCNRMKKDVRLRRIPFLLTGGPFSSRELTAHAGLACRADDYHVRSGAEDLDVLLRKIATLLDAPPSERPGRWWNGLRPFGFIILFLVLGYLGLMAVELPLPLAAEHFDTLDAFPYFTCAGVGALTVAVPAAGWYFVRGRASPRSRHVVLLVACVLGALWSVPLGLGWNRWRDRSPPAQHTARVVRYDGPEGIPAEGRQRCIVTSWRGREAEVLRDDESFRSFALLCRVGNRLVVATRAGALGWEWIEAVTREPVPAR